MPQSLANLPVHFVCSTKHRQPFINKELQSQLYSYITGILRNHGCQVIQIGGVEDHVHILFRLARTISVSQVAEKAKSGSTKWVREKWPALSAFEWQVGYGAFGVGVTEIQTKVAYIQRQEEHHKTESFKEEFLRLLEEHSIEYNEKYLWD